MSNLRMKANNFTGVFNSQYRIRPESDKNTFAMFYDVLLGEKWVVVDCVIDNLNEFNDTSSCIEEVVKRAEKRWNIELTKTILKVA